MKRLLKWLFLTIITVAISVGVSWGISLQLSTDTLAQLKENTQALNSCNNHEGVDESCNNHDPIIVYQEIAVGSDLFRPYPDFGKGEEVYCVEPGAALRTTGRLYEDIANYCRGSYSRCYSCHYPPSDMRSNPYYYCDNVHYTETYSGNVNGHNVTSLYDVAYITSYYPNGFSSMLEDESWSGGKQQALWMSVMSQVGDPGRGSYRREGEIIYETSQAYKQFYDQIVEEDEYGRTGMKPVDTTNVDEVKLDTDDTTDTHILGPFTLDYISGKTFGRITENVSFGGISNMYLIDQNGNKVEIDMLIRPEQEESYKAPDYFTNRDKKYPDICNPNLVDYYERPTGEFDGRNYPDPNEPFYVEFKYTGDDVSSLKLHIDFEYMKATTLVCIREGVVYYPATRTHRDGRHRHCDTCSSHKYCNKTYRVATDHAQNLLYIVKAHRELVSESIEIPLDKYLEKTMKLGGYVFEDTPSGKEQNVDGIMTEGDKIIPGAEVTLYEIDENGNAQLAKLATLREENPNATDDMVNNPDDYTRRINPTLSDENGYYEFRGLDTEKHYFVVFSYNGQTYMPTEYLSYNGSDYSSVEDMVNANQYDTSGTISQQWRQTSKALEVASERDEFDKRFAEIRSYPENYESTNSLNLRLINRNNGYNTTFSIYDLAGFNLTADGTYEQVHESLIDTHYYIDQASGMIMEGDTINEGLITTRIREFILQNRRYPTDDEMKNTIYQGIVNEISGNVEGGDDEVWRMLQFIEDCKINAYTINNMSDANSYDLYPVYDQFTTYVASGNKYPNNSYSNGTHDANASTYEDHTVRKNDTYITFKNIYQGQLFVNCGLWRRQETDMALRKDVYKATLKINDKTVIYNYDKRNLNNGDGDGTNNGDGNQDNQTYWDINLRMSDYSYYYDMNYNREIYETDYLYNTSNGFGVGHPGAPLEIYITYKVTVRNQSMSILSEIEEVVDFYDKDYTYREDLSWVTYDNNIVTDDEFYNAMVSENVTSIGSYKDVKSSDSSKYGNSTQSDIVGSEYNAVYVNGLQKKKLASGESAYIYLTFQVNKDGSGRVLLDSGKYASGDSPKENLAEINGYSTYYKEGTTLPNYGSKGANDIAGLIDRDSTPGNLVSSDLEGDRYEQNFEDDTDRAPSLRVIIDEDAVRKANGTVWEDQRTVVDGDAVIGNGIREDETGVSGVTVQLVEKREDGSEYIWYETTSNSEGQYGFDKEHLGDGYIGFIPGDYVIRFKYGDTDNTALTSNEQPVSYNGQDYKSTVYQTGLDENGNSSGLAQNANTDISGNYHGYTNTETQNESGTYGYDIYVADSNSTNYSDAKDLYTTDSWSGNAYRLSGVGDNNRFDAASGYTIQGRQAVINYSDGATDAGNNADGITNHIAEVLASPYERPSYNGTEYTDDEMRSLYNELIQNTQMTAETGVIVVEFEYDRQQTDGLNSEQNNSGNSSKDYVGDNAYNSNYTLNNIDFGLTERPKAQLEIDKSVANVKVTLANGSILFDINEAANNALWQDHKEYSIDEDKKTSSENNANVNKGGDEYYNPDQGDIIGMYEEYYGNDNKHRYSFREEIDKDVSGTDKGLIQLTMDEELMHGATIQITYTVKITNVGEVDYVDDATKDFYYRGDTSGTTVSTTVANQVVDYVQNNLTFDENNEANNGSNKTDGWHLITVEDLTNHSDVNQDLVNKKLESGENNKKLSAFNTIVQTESFGTREADRALEPGDEITRTLILSQLITPENTNDDLTYGNMVEIVKTSNSVGRRMAYSVVGNQDPSLEDASEVDANIAERIVILPPFGEVRIYYIIAGVVAVMLIGGIILIRRKVLKGK